MQQGAAELCEDSPIIGFLYGDKVGRIVRERQRNQCQSRDETAGQAYMISPLTIFRSPFHLPSETISQSVYSRPLTQDSQRGRG